jgi:hypothetical protein
MRTNPDDRQDVSLLNNEGLGSFGAKSRGGVPSMADAEKGVESIGEVNDIIMLYVARYPTLNVEQGGEFTSFAKNKRQSTVGNPLPLGSRRMEFDTTLYPADHHIQ